MPSRPFCHCEEALAEADVAIQSGSLRALPYAFAGLPRRAVALLAMTGCGGKAKGGKTEIPGERERGFFSTFLSLRALLGVAIHAGGVVCAARGSAGLPRRSRSSQ
jgi:hypothetical protein